MYHHIFVAGTFDGFHAGHQAVLSRAFTEGDIVIVGITTDQFVQETKKLEAGSWKSEAERQAVVAEWLKQHGWWERTQLISISDAYEPAASGEYDALIITSQNKSTGEKINELRTGRHLLPLALISVDLVPAQDGAPISSTRIRRQEIDVWGTLLLPDHMRSELKEPLGTIAKIADLVNELKERKTPLITVGDVTTDRMLMNGIVPDLSIIDLHARRAPYKVFNDYNFPQEVIPVHMASGPGNISRDAMTFISGWAKTQKKFVLVIHGEDDLLVLPAIYYAPIGSVVLYGQPSVGIVRLTVTEELKDQAFEYLQKFTRE